MAGVPSTDTILRSAIVTSIPTSEGLCTNKNKFFQFLPEPANLYGFPAHSWLGLLQPQSVASTKSFTFSMNDDFTTKDINVTEFPSAVIDKTATLVTCAFYTVVCQFTSETPSTFDHGDVFAANLDQAIKSPNPAILLTNIQNSIRSVNDSIAGTLWDRIMLQNITIELASFQLSPQISFEAVTFELPMKSDYMLGNFGYILVGNSIKTCDDQACIIESEGRFEDQIRLLPLCADENEWGVNMTYPSGKCDTISNSSVVIYSLARHIATDDTTVDIDEGTFTMKIPRMTYRATVGRLSWVTDDLSSIYGSNCTEGANCRGLYFPLSDDQRHLVLGEEHIPVPESLPAYDPSQWQALVIAYTAINSYMLGNVIPYRMSDKSRKKYHQQKLSDDNCYVQASEYINSFIDNHIYSKDPVQPAYTVGLFSLFQNAAVKQIAQTESSNTTQTRLVLDGNREWISIHASVPFISACVTLAGCGLTMGIALLIMYGSRQPALKCHIGAHNVSAVLTNTKQFPPFLVRVNVNQSGDNSDPFDRFEILQTTMKLGDSQQKREVREIVLGSHKKLLSDEVQPRHKKR